MIEHVERAFEHGETILGTIDVLCVDDGEYAVRYGEARECVRQVQKDLLKAFIEQEEMALEHLEKYELSSEDFAPIGKYMEGRILQYKQLLETYE